MGRAVRVTESDQRSRKATVLWWISIFKAGGGGGGRGWRKLLSLTDFVHLKHHRKQRPSSTIHLPLFPPLLSWIYWALALGCIVWLYVNIQHRLACKGLLRSVHDKTPKDSHQPQVLHLIHFFWSLHPHTWHETHMNTLNHTLEHTPWTAVVNPHAACL